MSDSPLRILVLANLPPYVLGGAENQTARLVQAWIDSGCEVMVAGHRIPSGTVNLGGRGVRTRRLWVASVGGRVARALSYFLSLTLLCLIERRRVDVIYCRGLGDAAISVAVAKSLRLCRIPVLACPINARGAGDVSFLRSVPGWRWIVLAMDRQIEAVNLINSLVGDELQSVGITRPTISTIPNGIEISTLPDRGQTDVRRLVWTGRLEAQKGLDLLFEALARLPEGLPPWSLELLGEGPLRDSLAAQAGALGLGARVTFRGALPAEDVREFLVHADAFILPSRYEGMSNSALEAMESGLPVLCTRCGGVDDYVRSGAGWVCEPGSVDALASMLSEALAEPISAWARKGALARSVVEQHMSVQVVAARNLDVLRSISMRRARP